MPRHGFPLSSRTHREARAPSSKPMVRGSQFGLPASAGGGRDHIVGGGGTPEVLVSLPDLVIDLTDGTRITFATAGVSPRP
jgi:hypothetical protein